uniref:9-divinyl ether synthase isoform X2 n=1 Tax=Nicotiana tabacum TaxID=4097 RepID=A0A1S3XL93_TOBAC|nr:PREDICTED: 9-divinyl ether synthase-like isoform X2 [Nicotiana tabacum]
MASSDISKLPLKEIPGDYGLPFFGAIKDRYDFHYNQGADAFFRTRMKNYQSTVFRTNVPPGPFNAPNSKVIVLVDAVSYPILFDNSKVDKENYFEGTFMSSTAFNGGYKVCGFLGTTDPKHSTLKGLFLSTLAKLHDKFIPIFISSISELFTSLEKELSEKGSSYFNPISDNLSFEFLFRLFCEGRSPTDTSLGTGGPKAVDKWVFFQLAPLISLGIKFVPNFLEDLVLHTFPLPYFPVKSDHQKLYNAFYNNMGSILDEAEKLGVKRDEACHNYVFLAGFNSYGGMKVFFPALIKWVGTAGLSLHSRLANEIRTTVKTEGGGVTFAALEKMTLVKSVVYETLRMDPPVPFQTVKARKDIVITSHDASFLVKKDELIFGYQPLATRDPKVFKNPEEFNADRFVGDGEKLLKYVYWSNGKETDDPTVNDKQCPGKDLIVLLGRIFLVELFLRYDTFEIEFGKLLLGSKVTFKSVTKATS